MSQLPSSREPSASGVPQSSSDVLSEGDRSSTPDGTDKADARPLDMVSPFTRVQKRRDKIVAEIEANRRGEYSVPTWVLALILLALIGGWAAIIIFS